MIQAIGLSTIDKKLDGMKMTQKQTYSYKNSYLILLIRKSKTC